MTGSLIEGPKAEHQISERQGERRQADKTKDAIKIELQEVRRQGERRRAVEGERRQIKSNGKCQASKSERRQLE